MFISTRKKRQIIAITKVNGMLLADKKVFVGPFISRQSTGRSLLDRESLHNVFVKNFADLLDEEKLRELFSQYGKIDKHCKVKVISKKRTNFSRSLGLFNIGRK